ncbi:MAG TPA: RsmB/NOP family class I SAM-dependent RNA methyltransferase [Bacteroidia bacterium]|nr:RsmB/NOP family class I SAM-dependent RNA methyltransferase [Bacteroidia bacterium]
MSSDFGIKKSFHYSRIQEITKLIEGYDGKIPFHRYLKDFFSKNKKFGSTDRKVISEWCFSFFRLGDALHEKDFLTRLTVGFFLVNGMKGELIKELTGQFFKLQPESDALSLTERLNFIKTEFPEFESSQIFKFNSRLSGDLKVEEFSYSMLTAPKVWIRVNKNSRREVVAEECEDLNMKYEFDQVIPNAVSFPANSNLKQLPSFVKGSIKIQDRSSQLAGSQVPAKANEHWWDCCCGAGGKSLQLLDAVPQIKITASDKRDSILQNFKERLSKNERSKVELIQLDLESASEIKFQKQAFDGILADVPCSGSGTWGRTPEMLTYFRENQVAVYAAKQQAIIEKVIPYLKTGGYLVYITCSVFEAENEGIVNFLATFKELELIKSALINGISERADTMFCAVFRKV